MQKTNRLQRLLAVVVAVFMAMCCLPLNAFAAAGDWVRPYLIFMNGNEKVGEVLSPELMQIGETYNFSTIEKYVTDGYKLSESGDFRVPDVNGTTNRVEISIKVKPVATTKEVGVNYYDIVNGKQVKEETITVPADATQVNTSTLTPPEGYEFTVTGDLQINDGYVYAEVKPVATTKEVGLNFYDEVNHRQVSEAFVQVDADATYVNTSVMTLPEGYEFISTGDLEINDGWVYVAVKPSENTRVIGLNYYDEVNNAQVREGEMVVDADAIHVNTSEIPALDGYEFTVTGDLAINDGWVYVGVKPVKSTRVVGLNYYDEVNDVQVCEKKIVVDADAINVNTSKIPALDGYEFIVTGDLQINDGWVYVAVKPAEGTRVVGLNYYDEVNQVQVCEKEMVVDADAIHVNTSEIPALDGYEFVVTGDLQINDGWVYVGVKPLETKTVGLNFFDEKNYEQVCEVEIEVPYNAIHLNTSEISKYLPEGYEFIELGDLSIRDGWVYVGVNCKWTLKIYWAIDNGEAADFADGSADTWTQELTWKHVNDDITMPEITVKDGYVFNGWSVSGQEGEFWKPSLKTVNVGDKYVADENGGIISITANIVTKEEAESGSSDNSDDNSTTVTSTNSNNNNTQVVKAEAPADNTAKVMPQTGLNVETPVVFGVMMVAALAGAGAYLFAIRKKLN